MGIVEVARRAASLSYRGFNELTKAHIGLDAAYSALFFGLDINHSGFGFWWRRCQAALKLANQGLPLSHSHSVAGGGFDIGLP